VITNIIDNKLNPVIPFDKFDKRIEVITIPKKTGDAGS